VKKYSIIYADPPWEYNVWKKKGKGRTAASHYATLNLESLKKLDVPKICTDDCVLFLWVTFPNLREGLELADSWGFRYKTVAFVWVKTNPKSGGLFVGLGHYTRANAEIVLLFTKGKALERKAKDVRQVIMEPRGKHSQKPDVVRERITNLFGDLPRVELFARDRPDAEQAGIFKGWDVFGLEVKDSIEIESKT
jgi:N6-adenosine-specific RNA methylase IME4